MDKVGSEGVLAFETCPVTQQDLFFSLLDTRLWSWTREFANSARVLAKRCLTTPTVASTVLLRGSDGNRCILRGESRWRATWLGSPWGSYGDLLGVLTWMKGQAAERRVFTNEARRLV